MGKFGCRQILDKNCTFNCKIASKDVAMLPKIYKPCGFSTVNHSLCTSKDWNIKLSRQESKVITVSKCLKLKMQAQDVIPRNAGLCFTCLITSELGNAVTFYLIGNTCLSKAKMPVKGRHHSPDICLEFYLPVCGPIVK